MKTTTPHTVGSRLHAIGEDVLGPVRAPHGSAERRILLARSVLAYGGLILTLIQIVVWLMIGILSSGLDSPWWLWTAVPAALGVAGLSLVDRWRRWWNSTSDDHVGTLPTSH
jgi:hypothetical protein